MPFFAFFAIEFRRCLKLEKRRKNFRAVLTKNSLFDGLFISGTYGFGGEHHLIQISTSLGNDDDSDGDAFDKDC